VVKFIQKADLRLLAEARGEAPDDPEQGEERIPA